MRFLRFLAIPVVLTSSLGGCANTSPSSTPTGTLLVPVSNQVASDKTARQQDYALSQDELDYDCKKLTGKMQLRILEIRDEQERNRSSALSRMLQSAVAGVTGDAAPGADPTGRYAKDVAMLKAYNAQLAAKDCKTYDLSAELVPKDYHLTPTPTVGNPANRH